MGSWTRKTLFGLFGAGLLLQLTGCGTLIYPERRGQAAGRFDTDIVVLDALGLFVGIVPGVIAFGVDLTTGAIYLPEGGRSRASEVFGSLEIERVPFYGRTVAELEQALRTHTGQPIELDNAWIRPLHDADRAAVEAELRALNAALARERVAAVPRADGRAVRF